MQAQARDEVAIIWREGGGVGGQGGGGTLAGEQTQRPLHWAVASGAGE